MLDQYKTSRWCKGIKDGQNLDLGKSASKEHMGWSSVWKMKMMRKMNSIITAIQMNKNARAHCEKYLMELKELVEFDVDSIHCNEDGEREEFEFITECAKFSWISSKRSKK